MSSMSRRTPFSGLSRGKIALGHRRQIRIPARRRHATMRWRAKLSTSAPEPKSSKPSSSSAADSGRRPGLVLAHRHGADHAAEHQPLRRLVFRSIGPGELRAADQAAIDVDRVGPDAGDRFLRRRVRGQRVDQRRHAGVEGAPRAAQRFLRLQHDREFGKIEAADEHQRAGAQLAPRSPWHGQRRRPPRAASPGGSPAAGRARWQTARWSVFRSASGPDSHFCFGLIIT